MGLNILDKILPKKVRDNNNVSVNASTDVEHTSIECNSNNPSQLYKVFVYGTLRSGYGNHRLLDTAHLLDNNCITTRDDLFLSVPDFIPYVVEASQINYAPEFKTKKAKKKLRKACRGHIAGELYAVDIETLRNLDALEGVPTFYHRKLIQVKDSGGGTHDNVIMYMYTGNTLSDYLCMPRIKDKVLDYTDEIIADVNFTNNYDSYVDFWGDGEGYHGEGGL